MDASVFAKMLSDPGMLDLKKMGYKYGQGDLQEFLTLLKRDFYQELPLHDFDGKPMVYLESVTRVSLSPSVWNQGDGRGNPVHLPNRTD